MHYHIIYDCDISRGCSTELNIRLLQYTHQKTSCTKCVVMWFCCGLMSTEFYLLNMFCWLQLTYSLWKLVAMAMNRQILFWVHFANDFFHLWFTYSWNNTLDLFKFLLSGYCKFPCILPHKILLACSNCLIVIESPFWFYASHISASQVFVGRIVSWL